MIAKSIVDVVKSIKNKKARTVSISGKVLRNDNFNNEALDVNDEFSKICRVAKLDFVTHKALIREQI